MSMDQHHDWRGTHFLRIPRAPKPEPAPARGHVDDDLKAAVFRMARDGKTCPEIVAATGMKHAKVRHMLLKSGIEFTREKGPAATKGKQ